MDFYSMLKSGTSVSELEKLFYKQVKEAEEKVAAEKRQEQEKLEEDIAEARDEVLYALLEYLAALCGETLKDEDYSIVEDIGKPLLIRFEKEVFPGLKQKFLR